MSVQLKKRFSRVGNIQDGVLKSVFIQSVYCGWKKTERRERISEPDRGEKIACGVVDVIGEGTDAFPPG